MNPDACLTSGPLARFEFGDQRLQASFGVNEKHWLFDFEEER